MERADSDLALVRFEVLQNDFVDNESPRARVHVSRFNELLLMSDVGSEMVNVGFELGSQESIGVVSICVLRDAKSALRRAHRVESVLRVLVGG